MAQASNCGGTGDPHKKLRRDRETLFAATLARSVGRLDWWNIKEEHTPYQWRCQMALYAVDPWGDTRDDMRAAMNTANSIVSNVANITDDQFRKLLTALHSYVPASVEDDSIPVDVAILSQIKEA